MKKVVNIFEAESADRYFWAERYDSVNDWAYRDFFEALSYLEKLNLNNEYPHPDTNYDFDGLHL